MQDSVFTKIIKGEIPCHRVYEDDKTIAFMDIHPVLPGHVLVVSKNQVDQIDDLPDSDYSALFATVKRIATQQKKVLGVKRAIVLVMGYDVPHAHVHVIPSNTSEPFYQAISHTADIQSTEPDHPALEVMAERLQIND